MKCSTAKKNGINKSSISVIIKTLQYLIKMSPWVFICIFIISILNSLFQAASIYAYQNLFDKMTEVMGTHDSYSIIVLLILAVTLIEIGIIIVQFVFGIYCKDYAVKKLHGYIMYKAHQKMNKLNAIDFEETTLFEEINKAVNSVGNGIEAAINTMVVVTYYIPYFLIMFIYFLAISPSIALIIVGTFLPIIVSNFISSRLIVNHEEKIVPYRRQAGNYESCILDKETRVLGAFGFLYERLLDVVFLLNKENWKLQKKLFRNTFISRFIRAIGFIFTYLILFLNLKDGLITIGVFGSVYITIEKLNGIASELFGMIGDSHTNSQKAGFFYKFLDMPERTGNADKINKSSDIHIKNVSFRYPYTENDTLKNINISLKKGEIIAIVGENGAGKTTFSKLLLGLYKPTSGEIYIDGKSISEYDYQSVTENISAVFQNFQKYKMTLEENITISDVEYSNKDVFYQSISTSDIPIDSDKFNEGVTTMLSRDFDGVELSGGEWQRVAIARGIYRRHDIIVLDEPTSAIDPMEESRLYHIFKKIGHNKTMIIITHRLGAARLADRILVLDNGKIVEDGSHEELINNNKLYKSFWEEQKKWYE